MSSNLPPGVTEGMLPGNRLEDILWDNLHEWIDTNLYKEHPEYIKRVLAKKFNIPCPEGETMNAEEAKKIIGSCDLCRGELEKLCSNGTHMLAKFYLKALRGPEITALLKGLIWELNSAESMGSWEECRLCKRGHSSKFKGDHWVRPETEIEHSESCPVGVYLNVMKP